MRTCYKFSLLQCYNSTVHQLQIRTIFLGITALIIVGVLFLSFSSFIARANVYHLYATTCLGGWENPQLAEGPPDAFDLEEAPQFSEKNSARLNGDVHAQIYCGGFAGEILKDTTPTNILVKFSASVFEPEKAESEKEPAELESQESEKTQDSEQTPVEESPLIEESVPVFDEQSPEESSSEEPTASLFNLFARAVHAQEIEREEVAESEGEVIIEPELFSESEPVLETGELVEKTENEKTPETGEVLSVDVTTVVSESDTVTEAAPYGIVEFLYTLDGLEWNSLGFVEKNELNTKHFEIPVEEASDWEDISKIQIGIQSVPVIDGVVPMMYLDSVWLVVGYNELDIEIVEEEQEEIALEEEFQEEYIEPEPELPILSVRNFSKDIVIDLEATHRCRAEPYSVDISRRSALATDILLEKNLETEYEIEIGGLPHGIDITFLENGGYLYSPGAEEQKVSLNMQKEEGSQKGNFDIPIIYTQKGEKDSSVVCQINIINL